MSWKIYVILGLFAIGALITTIIALVMKCKSNSPKARQRMETFIQQVTPMLDPDEKICASCGLKPCVAATEKRLFLSTGGGIDAVYYGNIIKARGTKMGQPVYSPQQMQFIELTVIDKITMNKKYYISNQSVGFVDVAMMIDSNCDFV